MKLSELNDIQRSHLAWRLDNNTWCSYITAGRIARGDFGDLELVDIFKKFDKSDHSAKILARKVINFKETDFWDYNQIQDDDDLKAFIEAMSRMDKCHNE